MHIIIPFLHLTTCHSTKKNMLTIVPPVVSFWYVSNVPFTISDLKTNIMRTWFSLIKPFSLSPLIQTYSHLSS